MQKAKILKGRSEYLFQVVVKKTVVLIVRAGVLSVLKKLGLSTEDYGLHSMRADGCIMARLGVKERFIKNMVVGNQIELKTGILTPP